MKPTDLERWSRVRRKGFWRFLALRGLVAWGIPLFVLMMILADPRPVSAAHFAGLAGFSFVFVLAMGALNWGSPVVCVGKDAPSVFFER
jgi:hypothetical protein